MKRLFLTGHKRNETTAFAPNPTECRELDIPPGTLLIMSVREDRTSGEFQFVRQKPMNHNAEQSSLRNEQVSAQD
jgi:hypothetical protein